VRYESKNLRRNKGERKLGRWIRGYTNELPVTKKER
jgi:hypothetical protein